MMIGVVFAALAASATLQAAGETGGRSSSTADTARGDPRPPMWIDERAATTGQTGSWSEAVAYDPATQTADICGEVVFTPKAPDSIEDLKASYSYLKGLT